MTHISQYLELKRLIREDNVVELANILNLNEKLNFNVLHDSKICSSLKPLLHVAVVKNSQKVLEYLLSQDFVDKNVCGKLRGENIYHVVCKIRGADQLFSIIERNVPHHLLLVDTNAGINAFDIACKENNIFIVKRVHEILESLKLNLTPFKCRTIDEIKNSAIIFALNNKAIEVTKYVLSMDRIRLNDTVLLYAIEHSTLDNVIYLLNVYLCQSIPSHHHNQFHIFQFSNQFLDINNRILKNNNYQMDEEKIKEEFNSNEIEKIDRGNQHDSQNDSFINQHKKRIPSNNNTNNANNNNNNNNNNGDDGDDGDKYDDDYYLKVEENFKKIMNIKLYFGNRIWHKVCANENLDVVQLIFSLKGVQPEILNEAGYSSFLIACAQNSNIKVIKYIHKLFPSFIHSQINRYGKSIQNGAYSIINNGKMNKSDKLNILHYLYLNGIDIHLLSEEPISSNNQKIYQSIYSIINSVIAKIGPYLKVISQDFDYINNEHDDKAYRKPSFWKEIDDNNIIDEQSKGIIEWKNRFDEHVLHHLSKMIQEHMVQRKN